MHAAPSKAELRALALAKRDALSDEQRATAAEALAKRGAPFEITQGMIISGYAAIRSELDPAPLMKKLAEKGARLALPCINARGQSLTFRSWSPQDRLMLGPLGIPEPSPAAAEVHPDVMLVPLAAFDKLGHRIGYGAGYYDRAIARLQDAGKEPRLIGIAFNCQEVAKVPDEAHDVIVPEILTESGLRRFEAP